MATDKSGWPEGDEPKNEDRRVRSTPEPLNIDPADIDPALGTLAWTRFATILDAQKSSGQEGALLVVDLDQSSRSVVTMTDENRNEILPLLADALRRAIRSGDLVAHLDACRFVVLLRGAAQETAGTIAERIHESVANTVFLMSEGIAALSVDVGGAFFGPDRSIDGEILQVAIANLHTAQHSAVRTELG